MHWKQDVGLENQCDRTAISQPMPTHPKSLVHSNLDHTSHNCTIPINFNSFLGCLLCTKHEEKHQVGMLKIVMVWYVVWYGVGTVVGISGNPVQSFPLAIVPVDGWMYMCICLSVCVWGGGGLCGVEGLNDSLTVLKIFSS